MILPLLIALTAAPADIPASAAVWQQRPPGKRLATIPPMGEEGFSPVRFDVDLRCRITDPAGHVHCITVGESPAGYGVGARTAAAFTRFAVLDMRRTPGSAPGRVVLVHYRFVQD